MSDKNKDLIFNYLITIHNKESLLEKVVSGVISSMKENSKLYAILDGCTDGSERIIDNFIADYKDLNIYKVLTEDVHELKAINVGLTSADKSKEGFFVILQDDVILNDPDIQDKVVKLYETFTNLGIVSFRQGGNLSRMLLSKKKNFFPIVDIVENVKGHNPNPVRYLKPGYFIYKEVPIKSPICIPVAVVNKIGMPDEKFAPWDDMAYCYKVSEAGYNNGVFALDFSSEIAWGTSRTKSQKMAVHEVHEKNIGLFKELFGKVYRTSKKRPVYSNETYKVIDMPNSFTYSWKQYLKGLKKIAYSKSKNLFISLFIK